MTSLLNNKIQKLMAQLKRDIASNVHLKGEKLYVMSVHSEVRMHWSSLSDEDKDFVHLVSDHLEKNLEWGTPIWGIDK